MRRRFFLFVKVVVSVGLLALLVSLADPVALRTAFATLSPWRGAGALALLVLSVLITGLRWSLILNTLDLPVSRAEAQRLTFAGVTASQLLPTSVGGDALRVLWLRQQGQPFLPVLMSVLFDRLFAVLGLACLVPVLLLQVPPLQIPVLVWPSLFLLAGLCAGVALLPFLDTLTRRWPLGPFGVVRNVAPYARRVVRPAAGLIPLLLSLANAALVGLAFALLCPGAPPAGVIVVVSFATLITLLPISLGGWGVREASLVQGLGLLGVSHDAALAQALLFGALTLCLAAPGALLLSRFPVGKAFQR